MHEIEQFIIGYGGDDLLHDVELRFPTLSFRAFYLGLMRAQEGMLSGISIIKHPLTQGGDRLRSCLA